MNEKLCNRSDVEIFSRLCVLDFKGSENWTVEEAKEYAELRENF